MMDRASETDWIEARDAKTLARSNQQAQKRTMVIRHDFS